MKKTTKTIVVAALIAASYAALTYASGPLAYGQVQFRLSECLMVLAAFTPAAIPGLTIGCFLGNLGSPFGLVDVFIGTFATLLASIITCLIARKKSKATALLVTLPAIMCNAIIVGLEITFFLPDGIGFMAFLTAAAWVALGETVVMIALGVPLYLVFIKQKLYKLL